MSRLVQVLVDSMMFDVPSMTLPVTVVEDTADLVALYFAAGTTYRQLTLADGSLLPRVVSPAVFRRLKTTYITSQYQGSSLLDITRPGRANALRARWELPGWCFRGWYVNMQSPMARTVQGFRYTDQFLDIVVDPDLTWRWKDEDELAEAVHLGRMTATEAAAVRAEGERVISDIETRRWPFDAGYEQWRPDPSWGIPPVPADWAPEPNPPTSLRPA